MSSPNITFFGTSHFSVRILEHLEKESLLPSLIVTAPDARSGRKLILTPPPVKVWATERDIEIIQPESLKEIPSELALKNFDLFIVVSYGKIIPKSILDIPEAGTLNVHPSLLPKLRGASPIQSAILNDEKETGVTIMLLDEEMDHGPIIAQASVSVDNWPPQFEMLEDVLASVGGELLVDTILPWINGDIKPEEQNHHEATYVDKIKKEDGLLDLSADAYKNFLKIRGLGNWPGTYFFVNRPSLSADKAGDKAGSKTGKNGKKIRVKIKSADYENNKLIIKRVVPEGKKEMDYTDFMRSLT